MKKPIARIVVRSAPCMQTPLSHPRMIVCSRSFKTSTASHATALPITATGPPPSAPQPNASQFNERIERKRKQAELLQKAKEIRQAALPQGSSSKQSLLRKRFWKEVHVRDTPEGLQVYLDARPVRTPNKSIITIPKTKPHLAHAIAIEWDLMVSAQQALKNHNIPMTSIVSRAQDIYEAEANSGDRSIRDSIVKVMMRYLDTDTLLCWAPSKNIHEDFNMEKTVEGQQTETLRDLQIRIAKPIISYLNTSVWPGVEIKPILDDDSIMPIQQSEVTRSIVSGWMTGLPAYELAALERAVLATKSLLIGTRLLIEWSEEFRDVQKSAKEGEERFGIEEAAEASTIEVRWQTGMWGEVEDTHDVDKEDVRRQLGSAILVVSGAR